MTTITLPWPNPLLSPNKRPHWAPKAKAVRVERELAHVMTRQQTRNIKGPFKSATITFYPPDRRIRDRGNMIASFKAMQDGIADALKWDDANWNEEYRFGPPEKPGKVEVELHV